MNEREDIGRIRNSSGSANIGTIEDGAILEMKTIKERLIIIKEKSVYELMLADSIDPDRTNPRLAPNTHRLLVSKGPDSQILAKSFLTAMTLFSSEHIEDSIDSEKAILLALDIAQELSILEKEIQSLLEEESLVSKVYEDKRGKPVSYSIPTLENLETRCKTIFQKSDHIEQILIEIISIFCESDGFTKQSHYPKFLDILQSKHGEEDEELKGLDKASIFMQLVRNLRNALDHRLENVTVTNFELQKDSNVISPTLELKKLHGSSLDRISLSEFLPILLGNLISIIERTIVILASKNSRSMGMIPRLVRQAPPNQRKYEQVEYLFWTPIGNDGIYFR
jgi:hypothetical protein